MFQSGRILLLVFDFLNRVGAYNLPVHGKIQQSVEPAQALVHLVRAASQIPQQESLVVPAKLFRHILQRYVRHIIYRFYVQPDTVLKNDGLPIGGA